MTIGELKKLIAPLDDDLQIIVVASLLDEDGDDCEEQLALDVVTHQLDPDTAEELVRFRCSVLEDFPDHDSDHADG